MSYYMNGRYTHDRQEYLRWRARQEADAQRAANAGLRREADQLQNELASTRDALDRSHGDVRELARLHALQGEHQRRLESVQRRLDIRQTVFERETRERHGTLEQEIGDVERRGRTDVEAAESRSAERVNTLRRESELELESVRQTVGDLRGDLERGLSAARAEIQETSRRLETSIGEVRTALETEVRGREERELDDAGRTTAVSKWVDERLLRIPGIDPLGLTMERTRTEQHLDRAREELRLGRPAGALAAAHTALSNYETLHLEAARRSGLIDGAADHVSAIADRLREISREGAFRSIFARETERLEAAAVWLLGRANRWRTARNWASFEAERERVADLSAELLARAVEISALTPGLLEQLEARERRLAASAEGMRAIAGAVDRIELSYADPCDVKSPRLLRGRIGNAVVDTYHDLDGTFRVDAYGFTTAGQCGEAARRMTAALAPNCEILGGRVDTANRQEPQAEALPQAPSWRAAAADLTEMAARLDADEAKG